MRALILAPQSFTLAGSFEYGFFHNNWETRIFDYRSEIRNYEDRIHSHINKFPFKIRSGWYNYFVAKVNSYHKKTFSEYKPDLVLVYNSELLLPETVRFMRQTSKVCFFLGDSPFYTPQNEHYLPLLSQADLILSPDSYWEQQLKGIGLDQTRFFLISSNPEVNHVIQVSDSEHKEWSSDLVFVGTSYSTAAGYKRALFLSQFAGLDIKIYTSRQFMRWCGCFPGLTDKVTVLPKRLTNEELNTVLNCCKIYPVDANPGLINGVHIRIFDCIASGIMPLAEYRKDVKDIFEKDGLPIIYDYKNAGDLARHYLVNQAKRKEIVMSLQQKVRQLYAPEVAIHRLLDEIKI